MYVLVIFLIAVYIWKSTCKFREAVYENLHVDPVFHNTLKNKQVEFNPYIYTLS